MVDVKGIYLSRIVTTTEKCIGSLGPIERKICEYLISVGDIKIEKSEKEYSDGGDDQ